MTQPSPLRWSNEDATSDHLLLCMVRATREAREPRLVQVREQALSYLRGKGMLPPEPRAAETVSYLRSKGLAPAQQSALRLGVGD